MRHPRPLDLLLAATLPLAMIRCDCVPEGRDLCGGMVLTPSWIRQSELDAAVAQIEAVYGEGSDEVRAFCEELERGIPDTPSSSSESVEDETNKKAAWTAFKAKLVRRYTMDESGDELPAELAFRAASDIGPCGDNGEFVVACASDQPLPEGDLFAASFVFEGEVPLDDAVWLKTYAVVFDQDGDDTNNWVPLPQYPGDFFQDTDLWYQLDYAPGADWTVTVSVADQNQNITPIPSDARFVIQGNSITAFIPADELADDCPDHRLTAFGHRGDYGFNPPHDWTADLEPLVTSGLAPTACG